VILGTLLISGEGKKMVAGPRELKLSMTVGLATFTAATERTSFKAACPKMLSSWTTYSLSGEEKFEGNTK
jgi:hypothetical protein